MNRLLFSTVLLVASVLRGQEVKQGDPNAVTSTDFHSPMVMTTVFAPADKSLWVSDEWRPANPKPWKNGDFTTVEYYGLGKYSCDGLLFRDGNRNGTWNSGLTMSVSNKVGGKVMVEMTAHVTNPGPVHDKFVTLLFEVTNGDQVVASTTITIKVKQNWRTKMEENGEEGVIALSADALKSDPITKLRITMTTKDY
ncbi:MAG: hypothetical protein WEB59_00630 [Thermoanaerobaculia bacterium]